MKEYLERMCESLYNDFKKRIKLTKKVKLTNFVSFRRRK